MIIDTTGYRTILEQQLAIAAIEFAIDQYRQDRNSPSIDARLDAAEKLYAATKEAWALLNVLKPELPKIGPVGIV